MVSPRTCLRVSVVALTLNLSVLLVVNTLLLLREESAVKEKSYVTLNSDGVIIEEQILAEDTSDYSYDVLDSNVKQMNCSENSHSRKRRELDVSRGMWDKSHVFKTYPFVVTGERWAELSSWSVCLSTQTSVDLLFWVVQQAETWRGPMSVAVFVPDVDFTIASIMIQYMKICFADVRERVSFHMVHPWVMPPVLVETKLLEYDCKRHEDVNKELVELLRTKELIKTISIARYPQNLMRNTARKGCQSDYCFTPDIDMLPVPGFSDKINNFVRQPEVEACKKCAYVIPTYEISLRAEANPVNKKELQELIQHKQAQRFHVKVFNNNQANTNLELWESLPAGEGLQVAYNVTTWKTHWEPIYVTKASVPQFDERFIGYGFTRNSQVYEMRVAGYTWHVLDNAFLTHRGFQTKRSHTKIRKRQIAENNGRYNVFVRELYQRYGVQLDDEDAKKAFKPPKGSKSSTRSKKRKSSNGDGTANN